MPNPLSQIEVRFAQIARSVVWVDKFGVPNQNLGAVLSLHGADSVVEKFADCAKDGVVFGVENQFVGVRRDIVPFFRI